jgi:uncharacterized phage protein (TIGR01671 family)
MNREIKFRYYDKQEQKVYSMNTGDMLSVVCGSIAAVHIQGDYTLDVPEEIILMQCTGLKDKNGKEIYEGDIVVSCEEEFKQDSYVDVDRTEVIIFKHGSFNFGDYCSLRDCNDLDSIEIIGNIYENPELLEKNNE